MTVRVAINGFGRIGRNILRAIVESGRNGHRGRRRSTISARSRRTPICCASTPCTAASRARSRSRATPSSSAARTIKVTAIKNPAELPHKELGVDIALECTGIFTAKDKAAAHLDGRRQARPRLGAGRRRRPHGRLRRQPRQADQGPPRRLERLLHDELPRPGRQGPERRHRHREGLHDDDPLLHQRPAVARPDAQGSLPRPRRGLVDDPDLDGRGEGRRPRAARAERQARRRRHPRADAERLGGRLQVHRQARDHEGRDQRRHQARRRAAAQGHPRLHRRSRTSRSTSTTTRIRPSSTWTRPRSWTARSCA